MWKKWALKNYITVIEQKSGWVLGVVAVVTVVMATGLPRLKIVDNSIQKLISQSHPLIGELAEVAKNFNDATRTVVVSVDAEGKFALTQSAGLELIKGLTDALKVNPLIKRGSILSLSTAVDIVSQDDDLVTEPLIQSWPRNRDEERALQDRIRKHETVYGRLISKDFKSAIIFAHGNDSVSLTEIHDSLTESIQPFVRSVPGIKVQLVGDVEVNYQINAGVRQDVVLFAFLSFILVLVGFYLAFRAWHGVVIPFLTITTGIVWTMGLIGWMEEPLHIISATVPIVFVIIGNAMSIHVYHVLRRALDSGLEFRSALTHLAKVHVAPLALAASTTFIGALSLTTFKFIPIQQFGIYVAFGSVVLFLGAVFLIPSLMRLSLGAVRSIERRVSQGISTAAQFAKTTIEQVPIAGKMTGALSDSVRLTMQGGVDGAIQGARKARLIERLLKEVARWVDEYPWMVLGSAALLTVLGATGASKIAIYFTNTEMLPKSNPVKSATINMERKFGGTIGFSIMLDTEKAGGALEPEFLKAVDSFLWTASQDPLISRTFSIVEILKKTHKVLSPNASEGSLPSSREALAQYLLLLEMNPTALSLNSLITSDRSKLKLSLMVSSDDSRQGERVYHRLRALTEGYFSGKAQTYFAGGQMMSILLMRNIVWGKVQNILSSLLCVFLLIAIVFRSISRGFYTLLSMPIGIAANFGMMGYMGLPLDMITAIATSIAMGFGTDLSIHMIAAIQEAYHSKKRYDIRYAVRHAIETRGETMVYNAMSDFMGFGVLIFSQFLTIQALAILLVWSLSVLQLSALLVIPAAIRIFQPEFITQHRRRHQIVESPMHKTFKWAFAATFIAVVSSVVWVMEAWSAPAKPLPLPSDLLEKSVQAIYTNNEESLYTMKLQGAGGDISIRKMKVFFKGQKDKDSKLLIRFVEPSDIRGTAFLTLKESGKIGDQWLYLPALKKSRRIRGGNKDEAFLGSDFTMGDLSVDRDDGLEYVHTGEEKLDSQDCFVLLGALAKGKDSAEHIYTKKRIWIRKDNFMTVKTEFFNSAKQLEKVMTMAGVRKDGARWVADSIQMKNLLTGHSTVLAFEKRESGRELDSSLFTIHALEKGR